MLLISVKHFRIISSTSIPDRYLFKHLVSLTENVELVKSNLVFRKVNSMDHPEAVIDAINQATVCFDKIGWNADAQVSRIIVVLAEREIKRFGHGNIVGLIKPSEGDCQMDKNAEVKRLKTDYIHPAQLAESLTKHDIRVLFIVHASKTKYYQLMSNSFKHQVLGIKNYSDVSFDTVKDIITEAAKTQKRVITFDTSDLETQFQMYKSIKCGGSGVEIEGQDTCPELDVNDVAVLRVNMKLKPNFKNKIASRIVVNKIHTIPVNVDVQTKCDCGAEIEGPDICSGNGVSICGKCTCRSEWNGDNCSCNKTSTDEVPRCKKTEDDNICGSRGECVCGECRCEKTDDQFYGDHCACSDLKCPTTINGICNGNGECKCNECVCNPPFDGFNCTDIDCNNSLSMDFCRRDPQYSFCSENGECICGKCKCQRGYMGEFCDTFIAPNVMCKDLERCVETAVKTKNLENCKPESMIFRTISFTAESTPYNRVCQMTVEECSVYFMVHIHENGNDVERIDLKDIDVNKDCEKAVSITTVLAIVIPVTVLLSLIIILIIYYIYYHIYEKRLYDRYLMELKKSKTVEHQNPLYSKPSLASEN